MADLNMGGKDDGIKKIVRKNRKKEE